jgi:hypothetical protein
MLSTTCGELTQTGDYVHYSVGTDNKYYVLPLISPENVEGKSQEGLKGTKSGTCSKSEEFPLDAGPRVFRDQM